MSGFGACQRSTCVCAIRAGLGEPGPGLEGGAPCPTTLGTGRWPPRERACGRRIPACSPGSGCGCWCRWIPRKLVAAWGCLGPAGPGPGVSVGSCVSGMVCAGQPPHLVFLPWGWRRQPWCLEGKPSLCPRSRGSTQTLGRGRQATGARRAPLLLWSAPASAGDGLVALSKPGGRAPHCKAGTPSHSGTGWDGCRRRDVLRCLLAQTCARWTSSRRWSPPAGWPAA